MKEKLTRNIGLKILSVILAAILWLVITNVDDPKIPKSFYNISVEVLNEDELTDLGQVYEITEGATIDFTVAARRSIADNLTSSDFKVTADLSKLSDVNATKINITCPRYEDDITITSGLNEVLKVKKEELAEKHFKVNVVLKGKPAQGYYVSEKTANTILRVTGPKSKIERIADVIVEVDVTDFAGSYRASERPKAVDEDGDEIDDSNLQFSANYVSINIGMFKTKTIDLNVTTTGEPADGYIMTDMDFEPKTIEIAAEDDILKDMDSFTVVEDIDGVKEDIDKEINIQEQLPDGVYLVKDNQTAAVNIKIEKAEKKEVMIWPGDIEIRNKPETLNLTYLTTGPIPVDLFGPKEKVKDITRDNLNPYIDISDYSNGTYSMAIGVDLEGDVTLSNNPTVNFQLTP